MAIQSIVFEKKYFTIPQAQAWLLLHKFRGMAVDEKKNTWRFRQRNPKDFDHYSTEKIGQHGILLIMGYEKK